MSKVFPTSITSNVDLVHGGEVKKFITPSKELLVIWESDQYSNMACLFGYEDNRMDIIKNDKRLFLGFSDAAPNVVLSPDPFPTKRLYLVLFDPRSRNYYSTAGDVFSNTKWPEYNELINLVDTGGYVLKNDVPLRKRIKLGIIYTHSQLDENVIQDQQQKSFLNSLNIRCNLHFSYHDDTDRKDTISTLKKQKTFIINLNDQETIMNTSTIAGLVEFISKRYIEVLPYMVDELNYPLSLSSNDSPLYGHGSNKLVGWFQIFFYLLLGLSKEDIINNFFDKPALSSSDNDDNNNNTNNSNGTLLLETYRPTIRQYLDCIEKEYGSFDAFLKNKLNVTNQDQERLQTHFMLDLNFLSELNFQITL